MICTSEGRRLTLLPDVEAGVHRIAIHVSPFPGLGLCDDFTLRRVVFRDCRLEEADFGGASLTDVVFERCELRRASFAGS